MVKCFCLISGCVLACMVPPLFQMFSFILFFTHSDKVCMCIVVGPSELQTVNKAIPFSVPLYSQNMSVEL